MKFAKLKSWAHRIKIDVVAIYVAVRHPDTPWYVKALAISLTAYAFSPIDLIPDFIPVLGYLDDLIILPLGIMLVVRMMPSELMAECRAKAINHSRPRAHWIVGVLVVLIWLFALAWVMLFLEQRYG